MAVAQVLRLRSLGQPWRMKQIPRNTRITSRDAWARVEGAAGTNSSTTVLSIGAGLQGQLKVPRSAHPCTSCT